MGRRKAIADSDIKASKKQHRPATTPEGREKQLIALATDLAEKQLREGTASSQVITHYLKLGSSKDKIERDILKEQKDEKYFYDYKREYHINKEDLLHDILCLSNNTSNA